MNNRIGYICFPYNSSLNTGRGHDRYAFELIRVVRESGIPTVVWEGSFLNTTGSGGLGTIAKGMLGGLTFPWLFRKPKVDIFHATSAIGGATAACLRKKPLITSILDVIPFHIQAGYDLALKYRFKKGCIETAARRSDLVITLFESNRQTLIEKLRIPESRILRIPLGLDHKKFYPGPEKSLSGTIVFLGEATRSKGLDTLIEAMPKVLKKCPFATLKVASYGRDLPALCSLAQSLGVSDHIHFSGFIPEDKIRDFYLMGDCAVFPSRYGFGLPTLEAMACGIPTIAGDTLDATEFVRDNGILVKPGDTERLAEAIILLLTEEKARQGYIRKGLECARGYTWEAMGQKYLEAYRTFI